MPGFREAVLATSGGGGTFGWGGHRGSAPTPFDGVDAGRLAGPSGSHPLAAVSMQELLRRSTDGLDGVITLEAPASIVIGDGIRGRLALTARREVRARAAALRLVGGLLTEQRRSKEDRDSKGNVTNREEWVEVNGRLFEQLAFTDVPLPATLAAGQRFEADFLVPAPRLGPVSAHLGSAIICWALEAKWDVPMRGDERVAALVDVGQNIDYLRSGAVNFEAGAMFDSFGVGGGSIAVSPLPPARAGAEIDVTVNWPGAGTGRGARLELQAHVDAPNGISGLVLFSAALDPAAFHGGATVRVPIPLDAPPTLAAHGVGVKYRLRALVDRAFRSDLAIERAIAVM